MKKAYFKIVYLILIQFLFFSCEKAPTQNVKVDTRGNVLEKYYNKYSLIFQKIDTLISSNKDVIDFENNFLIKENPGEEEKLNDLRKVLFRNKYAEMNYFNQDSIDKVTLENTIFLCSFNNLDNYKNTTLYDDIFHKIKFTSSETKKAPNYYPEFISSGIYDLFYEFHKRHFFDNWKYISHGSSLDSITSYERSNIAKEVIMNTPNLNNLKYVISVEDLLYIKPKFSNETKKFKGGVTVTKAKIFDINTGEKLYSAEITAFNKNSFHFVDHEGNGLSKSRIESELTSDIMSQRKKAILDYFEIEHSYY